MDDVTLLTVLSPDCDAARDETLWTLALAESGRDGRRLVVTVGGERMEPIALTHMSVDLTPKLALDVALALLKWAAPRMAPEAVVRAMLELVTALRVERAKQERSWQ